MPSRQTRTGRLPWPIVAAVVLLELAALCVVWALTRSDWAQWGAACVAGWLWWVLWARAAERDPFPIRPTGYQVPPARLALLIAAMVLLGGAIIGLDRLLRSTEIYPGPWAVSFLWVIAGVIAWNRFGWQTKPDQPGDVAES